ncbi:VOC family protein, partial [Brachybacterium alimentarium]|uniref:VOC family protein n=1 Tax=Brachybacterium alimentarium TaxID=47845 RepID=UPI003FD18E60
PSEKELDRDVGSTNPLEMASFISHTSIDCHDAFALSEWWRMTLGYETDPADPNRPGDDECPISDPDTGHTLLFLQVGDHVLPDKRIHFDLRPRERTQDAETTWLLEHGATVVADRRGIYGPGSGWTVMADPEGNQFCVVRSPDELASLRAGSGTA